jgi:hypothetical protein
LGSDWDGHREESDAHEKGKRASIPFIRDAADSRRRMSRQTCSPESTLIGILQLKAAPANGFGCPATIARKPYS